MCLKTPPLKRGSLVLKPPHLRGASLEARLKKTWYPIPGLVAPSPFGGGAFGGGGFGAVLGASQNEQNIENPVADLWPYYKLWFEYHWKKCIKQDVKAKNSVVLRDKNEISGRKW